MIGSLLFSLQSKSCSHLRTNVADIRRRHHRNVGVKMPTSRRSVGRRFFDGRPITEISRQKFSVSDGHGWQFCEMPATNVDRFVGDKSPTNVGKCEQGLRSRAVLTCFGGPGPTELMGPLPPPFPSFPPSPPLLSPLLPSP